MASLTPRVEAWRREGEMVDFGPHSVFVRERVGAGPPVLLLHGYPSSSYDWRHAFALLPERHLVTFDFLGFGLSDKPARQIYSLMIQADLVQAVVDRAGGDEAVIIVAHDMATSVVNELMARDLDGRLPFAVARILLFNGSMVIERASLTVGQKMLRSRFGAIAARLSNERTFRAQFARIFSREHPLTPEEAADQWALLAHHDGHRILDRLTYYLHERVTYAARWHRAIADWPGHVALAWAEEDPVCTESVLQAVLELRPAAPLTRLTGLGHYPQLEDPRRTLDVVARFCEARVGSRSA